MVYALAAVRVYKVYIGMVNFFLYNNISKAARGKPLFCFEGTVSRDDYFFTGGSKIKTVLFSEL